MTSITAKNVGDFGKTKTTKSNKGVETTGSIASNYSPLFNVPMYNFDMFIPTNPFSLTIDYSAYSQDTGDNIASNFLFMQSWANSMQALSDGELAFGGFTGGDASCGASGGFSGGGSCSCGGGFTSVG